jgi:hypothetical protein
LEVLNPFDLPQAYVNAVSKRRIPQPKRISVTELLTPARLRALWLLHYDEIPLIAGDNDHALFHGNAVHEYLRQHAGGSAIVESQLTHRIGDWTIHGTPDHLDFLIFGEPGHLTDWKTTTVRALQYDKPDWEAQINLYAWLLQANGYEVDQATCWIFLRDWDRNKRVDPAYPRSHACRIDVPLWEPAFVQRFMEERLQAHIAAQTESLPDCTDEERWKRSTYAVYSRKPGTQRASMVSTKFSDAVQYAVANTKDLGQWESWWSIEEREGQPLRCATWCQVAPYCGQWQSERAETMKVGT